MANYLRRLLNTTIVLLATATLSHAQVPPIQWQKSLGGSGSDVANDIKQTADGGYIVAGSSISKDGDVTGNHLYAGNATSDYWIVKLTATGAISWQKSYGGTSTDVAYSVQQTADGGYIVAGSSSSIDGDVTGHNGTTATTDYWILKLDANGALTWQKSLGGTGSDVARSVQQTADGGYIVAGFSNSTSGDIIGNHGSYDAWVVKLDASGALSWQHSLGGTGSDAGYFAQQTKDGGYIVAASASAANGDVPASFHGITDAWLIKLDATGSTIQWTKCYGGTGTGGAGNEAANVVQQTYDGGYIFTGYTSSPNSGDVGATSGGEDWWTVKIDATGTIKWQATAGSTTGDHAQYVQQTKDSGYIVAGYVGRGDGANASNGFHGPTNVNDYLLIKYDSLGNVKWQSDFGGTKTDVAYSVAQTSDSGYVVAGSAMSNNYQVSGNHGSDDYWVLKLGGPSYVQHADSIVVTTLNNVAATITSVGGTLQLVDTVLPNFINQAATWSIANITGTATISATGLVTAHSDGTVWGIGTSVQDPTKKDSVLITISGQGVVIDSVDVKTQGNVPATITVDRGTLQLTSTVFPLSSNQAVTWSILLSTGSATISNAGLVTAQTNGNVYARAISVDDNSKRDSILIVISNQLVDPDSVRLSAHTGTITVPGGTTSFKATVYPKTLSQTVNWSIRNVTGAASVASNGTITAIADGTVWAIANASVNTTASDSALVTISGQITHVDSVVATTQNNVAPSITTNGGTLQLMATVYPLTQSQTVTWSIVPVSGSATINSGGLVTAQTNGTVWAIATSTVNTNVSDSVLVTISNQVVTVTGVVVTTQNGVPATIGTPSGTLQLIATVFPSSANQAVNWSIRNVTGAATISSTGLVTAQTDGTVWAKAVSVQDITKSDSILVTISGQTGVATLFNDVSVNIYPNPATNNVTVSINGQHAAMDMTLSSIDGKVLQTMPIPANQLNNSMSININNLSAGVYVLQLHSAEGIITRKIIKQ